MTINLKDMAQFREKRHKMPKIKEKIIFVDGFSIRNINPDLDIINWRRRRDKEPINMIPKGQLWIDIRFADEKAFLLNLYKAEKAYKAKHGPNYSVKNLRQELIRNLTWDGIPPSQSVYTVRTQRKGKLLIRFVNGGIIRQWIDPWFLLGGHDKVYGYISDGEVWIDEKQDPREVKYTLIHEIRERWLMCRGYSYNEAHEMSTEYEKSLRVKELAIKIKKQKFAIKMKPYVQEKSGSCAQASAKIVLDFFKKKWPEKDLWELTGFTEDGTDREPLIEGLRKTGATVSVKNNGTVEDLKKFISMGLPVIVGWWSMTPEDFHFNPKWDLEERKKNDCGHFSVISGVSDKSVTIIDPDGYLLEIGNKTGKQKMSLKEFKKVWYDTDGPEFKLVRRWMMVLNFNGRHFRNMKNYPPTFFPKYRDNKVKK